MMDEQSILLEGRVLAQELMMRIVMTAVANGQGRHPASVIDGIKRDTMETLQFADRPIGEREDAVWEETVRALEREFAAVRNRLVEQSGEPPA